MPVGLNNRFLLLYGSQTGQAKAIAEEIAEKADNFNLHADLHCFSETEKKFYIEREKCVVIVTSTTGDGEPPDTALKFFRRIKKKTLPDDYLSHLSYAILGLGDSNYTNFCNCSKTLDKRLQELGAKHFYEPGWADDAVGLEIVVEPWMENLFPAVKQFLGQSQTENSRNIDSAPSFLYTSQPQLAKVQVEINGFTSSLNSQDAADGTLAKTTYNSDSNKENLVLQDVTNTAKTITQQTDNAHKNDSTDSETDLNVNANNINVNVNACTSTVVNDLCTEFHLKTDLEKSTTEDREEGSLRKSLSPLSETVLSVPVLPPPYLKIDFLTDSHLSTETLPLQNGASFASASSAVVMAKVKSIETLTSPLAVKKALNVTLDISGTGFKYQPGDSFSLVCPNNGAEVNMLLKRLKLSEQAHRLYKLTVLPDTKKKHASVPSHIYESSTLYHTLMTCVDIREPPKKALLRALVEYTENPDQKRRLQELCSKQGASEYTKYIREPNLSILDLLHCFDSCHPPIERILEHSPRLQPRPYSVSSSPLTSPDSLSFVFNIVDIPHGSGRSYNRKGVATGWLETIQSLQPIMDSLKITTDFKVPIFSRTNQTFHLPDDVTSPIILIGPGTGVAPFIGFLDHVAAQRQAGYQKCASEIWLFFGCRHKSRDFLFQKKLEAHLESSTLTKLLVSFSRDENQLEGSPLYVQDNVRSHGQELVKLLEERKAIVYVCGDAKNMAKDVNEAFIDIVSKEKGISLDESRKYMMKLRLEKRYREDVWT